MKASWASAVSVFGAVGAIALVTAAAGAGRVSVASLASTPRTTGEGKVWLLFSSALLADRPAELELLAFAGLALVVLLLVGPVVLWTSAILGHVGSTLAIYGFIAVAGLVVPTAFDSMLSFEDYGTSAMTAAWVGVIAAVGWQRYTGAVPRLVVAAFCVTAGSIAWAVHPGANVFDGEHVVAFVIGIASAQPAFRRVVGRLPGEWWRAARAAAQRRQLARVCGDSEG